MNLHVATIVFKRMLVGFGIFVILYLIFVFALIPATKVTYALLFPKKDLPNTAYGILPALEFTEAAISNKTSITYELNTTTGKLPTLPNKIKIYKYETPTFSYQSGKTARDDAGVLGFLDSDLVSDLKGDIYSWKNNTTKGTLDIKISTKELKLETPSLRSFEDKYIPGTINSMNAQAEAATLFTRLNRFDALYQKGKFKVVLGQFSGNKLVTTSLPSAAQIAKVDLYRSIDATPILGPNPGEGLLSVTLRSVSKDKELYLNYPFVKAYYWKIDEESNATYPLLPISVAWQAVSAGNGVIAEITPKDKNPFEPYTATTVNKIIVNDVYIAYFDDIKPQKYLQPIYVFEGNYTTGNAQSGTATVYYPAVQGQYVENSLENATPTSNSVLPN